MKILLTGASGFVGRHTVNALLKKGHEVTVCIHSKNINQPKLKQIAINFSKMKSWKDWKPLLQGYDVVINCVGIIVESKHKTFEQLHYKAPATLFEACEKLKIFKLIQISALGADESASVPYHLSKKAADDVLRLSNLSWFILRPSFIYGDGGKSFALFTRLSNLPFILLFNDGQQQIQPVHISDVVATIMRCLDQDIQPQQTIDVVGKQAITYQGWMLALRHKSYRPLFIQAPTSLIMVLSHIGKFINLALFNPDSLRMLQQNNIAESDKLIAFLRREPLSISEGLLHKTKQKAGGVSIKPVHQIEE